MRLERKTSETVARKRRKPTSSTGYDRRRRRRIRWVLGIWAGLLLIAAIAYAIKKRLDPSGPVRGRSDAAEYISDVRPRSA